MEELIQGENKKAEEVFVGDRKGLVLKTQDVDKFGKKVASMMSDVMRDYERYDEVHQKVKVMQDTIIVKAEEQIKKEFKLLVDRIIEAVRDMGNIINSRYEGYNETGFIEYSWFKNDSTNYPVFAIYTPMQGDREREAKIAQIRQSNNRVLGEIELLKNRFWYNIKGGGYYGRENALRAYGFRVDIKKWVNELNYSTVDQLYSVQMDNALFLTHELLNLAEKYPVQRDFPRELESNGYRWHNYSFETKDEDDWAKIKGDNKLFYDKCFDSPWYQTQRWYNKYKHLIN